ncbi:HlyD family efflux transporter periplasmic adaptor subunit [Pinirhizobacter soli]|uniref:HlyD family efflux transporter periplasmic adaptor subunit n=1 Tax=Pinirhizobacter soli TaxID=2786953 RepID=UPI00202A854B|nr:HlyD family efflux transporter periplasmic adaptor subunit [Pinirhizobacter soli]
MNALPVLPDSSAPTPLLVDGWSRFVAARTSAEFCDAWLTVLRDKFPLIVQAAILVESSDGQNYVPIAVWPQANSDMARMGEAVQRALTDRRVVVQPCAEPAGLWHVAAPLAVHDRIAGSVVLELTANDEMLPGLLRELHWGSAWLSNLFIRREHDAALAASVRSLGVLEAIAIALRHERFQQALFDLSNELRRRFAGTRVAIGLMRHGEVKLTALSEAATFEKSSPLVQAYSAAMNEACDLAQPVEAAAPEHDAPDSFRAHTALLQRTGAGRLLSLPITQQAKCIAVVTIEREAPAPFGEEERKWLETFGALLAPVIAQRVDAERGSWQRLRDEGRRFLAALLGPRHLLWKAGALAAALVLALLVFLPVSYRVSAKTVTEGESQRVAAAPFEGFLAASFVRAGDIVAKGQPLAQLDDHDLRVERAKWASERDQYDNKLREAMAGHDQTAMQVVGAQLREAQAQLDLLDDKLSRVKLLAPYDGVVVTGDLSQQVGTPVEAGKKLFEIAPLHSYRIILQVDERDIGQVRAGQSGELVMTGLAGEPMPFTIAKIMPVATAQDGHNFYRVEARLKQDSPLLLPGMEGIGKIGAGDRKLGWVLLHSLFDWLRLNLWSWGL